MDYSVQVEDMYFRLPLTEKVLLNENPIRLHMTDVCESEYVILNCWDAEGTQQQVPVKFSPCPVRLAPGDSLLLTINFKDFP